MHKKQLNDYLSFKKWTVNNFGELKDSAKRYHSKLINKSKRKFQEGSVVLEIGFGNGTFLEFARQKKWKVCGTEIEKDLVKIATKKGFYARRTNNLDDFESSRFDLVIALDVLEHIQQDKLINFLSQVKRVLKKDGIFIARFPNGDSPLGLGIFNGDMTHVTAIGLGKVKHIVSELGVQLVFAGGDIELIIRSNPITTVRNIISFFIKKLFDFFVNFVFHRKNYSASNLVMVFKKNL